MAGHNKWVIGCKCCGGSGGVIINPGSCTCTAVPGSLSVTVNYGRFSDQPDQGGISPRQNAQAAYPSAGLTYYGSNLYPYRVGTGGWSAGWYSDVFQSGIYFFEGFPGTPVIYYYDAYYYLSCFGNQWSLRFGSSVSSPDGEIPSTSGAGPVYTYNMIFPETNPLNWCDPFLLSCGFDAPGACSDKFIVS